ncbi:hypothetical protein [Candidatus Sodalis pierantonius]|uniref:hypothetical protein n=1 Tax=Candidatus Sodalis pierantonii TaxID=1486991 RepID=UPI00190F33DC|nr:hypothetical protein [Candidatus Sodalis pierantonius]
MNASDAPWVDAMSVPQPLAQRTYIFATANGGDWLASTYARVKDDPQWKAHALACCHAIMLDRPEELTAILLAETAVSSVGPQANIAQ